MPYNLVVLEEFVKKNLAKNLEKANIEYHVTETPEGFRFRIVVGSHEISRIKKLLAKSKKRILPRIPKPITPKEPKKESKESK